MELVVVGWPLFACDELAAKCVASCELQGIAVKWRADDRRVRDFRTSDVCGVRAVLCMSVRQ